MPFMTFFKCTYKNQVNFMHIEKILAGNSPEEMKKVS